MPEAGRPFDWCPWLEPGEALLWQGRPGAGAGWRSALADVDAEEFTWLSGRLQRVMLVALLPLMPLLAVIVHKRLHQTRYAITDRRTLCQRGVFGPDHLSALSHDDLDLRIRQSAAGQTVYIGRDHDPQERTWRQPGTTLSSPEARRMAGMANG